MFARKKEPKVSRHDSGIVPRGTRQHPAPEDLVVVADLIAVVTPVECGARWERGRIVTLTRFSIDRHIAGDPLRPAERGWVRTLGGTVGSVCQFIDGEAAFCGTTPSLVFLIAQSPRTKNGNVIFEVIAGAHGQFPLIARESMRPRFVPSPWVSVLAPDPDAYGIHPFEVASVDEVAADLTRSHARLRRR